MNAKEEAKFIYDGVVSDGLSTDYCYSPDFKKWCVEKAVNRARSSCKNDVEEVVFHIKNI